MEPQPDFNIQTLVTERGEDYDESWMLTAVVIKALQLEKRPIWRTPLSFAWIMVLNKLIRAMFSPTKKDHWVDMQGYAELVREQLDKPSSHVEV